MVEFLQNTGRKRGRAPAGSDLKPASRHRRSVRPCSILAGAVIAGLSLTAPVVAADPDIPPGTDPGGLAIALIGTGFDYTDADLSARVARDGEGELIGWDAVDGDVFPFAGGEASNTEQGGSANSPAGPAPSGTRVAKLLAQTYKKSRLVLARADGGKPATVLQSAHFAAKTPARIIAVSPGLITSIDVARAFAELARREPTKLFVVPARRFWSDVPGLPSNIATAASLDLREDLLAEDPVFPPAVDAWMTWRGSSMFGGLMGGRPDLTMDEAVALAAAQAACAIHGRPDDQVADGAAVKALFTSLAVDSKSHPGLKVHDPMCWYGGVRY